MMKFYFFSIVFLIFCGELNSQSYYPVSFLVIDATDQLPINNASIAIKEIGYQSKISGEDGKLYFSNIPEGEIHFFVTKEGYSGIDGTMNVTSEVKSNTLRVLLSKIPSESNAMFLFSGELVDESNNDIPNADIEVRIGRKVIAQKTDNSGNFNIEINLSEIKYNVNELIVEAKFKGCTVKETIPIPKSNYLYKELKAVCSNSTSSKDEDNSSLALPSTRVQELGDWKFELIKCVKKGRSITFRYAVTSRYKNRYLRLHLGGFYSKNTLMYDDMGNEYRPDYGTIANNQVPGYIDRFFIADVRTEGTVTFTNIASNASSISALYLCFGGRSSNDAPFEYVGFKNISFE